MYPQMSMSGRRRLVAADSTPIWDSSVQDAGGNLVYSNNNHTLGRLDTIQHLAGRGTVGKTSGKWYFKVSCNAGGVSTAFGIGTDACGGTFIGSNGSSRWSWSSNTVHSNSDNRVMADDLNQVAGDYECAFDLDEFYIWFRKDGGDWNNNASSNPSSGIDGLSIIDASGLTIYPVGSLAPNTSTSTCILVSGSAPGGFTAL